MWEIMGGNGQRVRAWLVRAMNTKWFDMAQRSLDRSVWEREREWIVMRNNKACKEQQSACYHSTETRRIILFSLQCSEPDLADNFLYI